MMFILTLGTGNDAFAGDPLPETARLLAYAAGKVEGGAHHGALVDLNGNRVGSFQFVDDDAAAALASAAHVGLEGADPEGTGHTEEALAGARDLAERFVR